MPFELLIFDLDGTLYDQSCGYEDHIHSNIYRFMVETKGGKFDAISTIEEAKTVWQPIFDKYNLTKRGLLGEGFEFDSDYYDHYVRKGPEAFIRRDPELRSFLESLPQRKIIFTNAPESSAIEILKLLGVDDLFDSVLGTSFLENKVCKPEKEAFDKVLAYVGVLPQRICYFEDSFKNLLAGKNLGFSTVFVTSETLKNEGKTVNELGHFDAVVAGKVDKTLERTLPELFVPID